MKIKQSISIVLASILLLAQASAAQLSLGSYTAETVTLYLNPDTGIADDSGKNPEIGEGMCRSAVYETALIEQTAQGCYVTIRMKLASNLKNVSFSVQQTAGDANSYVPVSPTITAENGIADTADYRFAVPVADAYIRCDMYVTPMKRDVIFYLYVDAQNAASGSGDFSAELVTTQPIGDYSGHWAQSAIEQSVQHGWVDTDGAGNYHPDENVTRRVFVTGLARLSGVSAAAPAASVFTDVAVTEADAAYLMWAHSNGIVNGKGEGLFAPNDSITRQEMATMLARYLSFAGVQIDATQLGSFADQGSISDWALDAVRTAQAAGLLTGKDGNRFDPLSTATRAEFAAILLRLQDCLPA